MAGMEPPVRTIETNRNTWRNVEKTVTWLYRIIMVGHTMGFWKLVYEHLKPFIC